MSDNQEMLPICVYCLSPRKEHLGDGACDEGRSTFWLPAPATSASCPERTSRIGPLPHEYADGRCVRCGAASTVCPSSPQPKKKRPEWIEELAALQAEYESVKGKTFHSDWPDFLFVKLSTENTGLKTDIASLREDHAELVKDYEELCTEVLALSSEKQRLTDTQRAWMNVALSKEQENNKLKKRLEELLSLAEKITRAGIRPARRFFRGVDRHQLIEDARKAIVNNAKGKHG